MTQTTVTLTGGVKVNLNINTDRVSHLKAREALEAIQEREGVSQATAVEMALCGVAQKPPVEALEHLATKWNLSDAATVREALRRYATEVQTE